MILKFVLLFSCVLSNLYSGSDDVLFLNSNNFDKLVTNSDSPILVEFYANWCGHCKNLAPEWKKAASALKGIARLGVVDSDESAQLMQKYNIKGFPTILFFHDGKQSQYNGQRTSAGIVDEYIRLIGQISKNRLGGGQSNNKQASVIELNDNSFDEKVMSGDGSWFVEFFAPWCGHCKNLAPLWKEVAAKLSGKVNVAAVDATANEKLSQRFNIKGFPTLIFFSPANPEGILYESGRSVDEMVKWAEEKQQYSKPPVKVTELTSQTVWDEMCGSRSLCVVAFLPHLLDCNSTCRVAYQNLLQEMSDSLRRISYGWLWVEGGVQTELEKNLEIGGFGYPAMVVVSRTKMMFTIFKGSFDREGINEFLGQVAVGRVSTGNVGKGGLECIQTTDPWDGKDAEPYVDEYIDLSDVTFDDL